MILEDQLRELAASLELDQQPITAEEALGRASASPPSEGFADETGINPDSGHPSYLAGPITDGSRSISFRRRLAVTAIAAAVLLGVAASLLVSGGDTQEPDLTAARDPDRRL